MTSRRTECRARPGVDGAAPGVGAALQHQPRGAQDAPWEHAAHEVKLYQLGLRPMQRRASDVLSQNESGEK